MNWGGQSVLSAQSAASETVGRLHCQRSVSATHTDRADGRSPALRPGPLQVAHLITRPIIDRDSRTVFWVGSHDKRDANQRANANFPAHALRSVRGKP